MYIYIGQELPKTEPKNSKKLAQFGPIKKISVTTDTRKNETDAFIEQYFFDEDIP